MWRVGSHLHNFVSFTQEKKMPAIVPQNHRATLLTMREAHLFSQAGQDGTLSRSHINGYWAVWAGHLAKTVKRQCVPCRKVDGVQQLSQMGNIPAEQFEDLKPWEFCSDPSVWSIFMPSRCQCLCFEENVGYHCRGCKLKGSPPGRFPKIILRMLSSWLCGDLDRFVAGLL